MAPTISRPFVPLWLARCRKQQQRSTARPWSWQERLWCLNLNPQPHDENKQERERERSCFRSFYHQERRRRKARGKEILKNACLIFTSNSWNFKLVSRKYHVTRSNQGLVLENCMNKKPKKKKKVSPSTVTRSTGLVVIISASALMISVCSLYQVHLPLLPVAL